MQFRFRCYGHENILSTHRNTIEFTKDSELTRNGDCIIGVRADFDYDKLREFIEENKGKKIRCEIVIGDIRDEFTFFFNPDFSDKHEIVIRKTEFRSERTLGIKADKAARDIRRDLVKRIKDKKVKIEIKFTA